VTALRALLVGVAAVTSADLVATQPPQRPDRPVSRVVGTPSGGARVDRVDPHRTGLCAAPLPASRLRVAWRAPTRAFLDRAPLVDSRGVAYAVGVRGEVTAFGGDGAELWTAKTGAPGAGPGVLLSDDTVSFVDGAGEVYAVRAGKLRWKAHAGQADATFASAPLALDGGGLVAPAGADMAVLDADGLRVARVRLPEPIAAPLVAAKDRVVAGTLSGAVWTWTPGAAEATRTGSFEAPTEGAVALTASGALLGVSHGGLHLTELHLDDGTAHLRAASSGALWTGSPAVSGDLAVLVAITPTSEMAVTLDAAGHEAGTALLQSRAQALAADAGPLLFQQSPPTPLLIDAGGTVVFATSTGDVGSIRHMGRPDAVVDTLSAVCPVAGAGAATVAGIAPLGPHAVVVACHHGELVGLTGDI
jgi:hypothetical protein